MRNAGLEEAQAAIKTARRKKKKKKTARRNINNLRYADDMILYTENHKDSTQNY